MAILLDSRARDAVRRRQAAGKPSAISLHVTPVFHSGSTLVVEWSSGREAWAGDVLRQDGATLRVDPRVRRYARWHDIVISAERVGPFVTLALEDPLILARIRRWELTHPDQTVTAMAS
jgi:hypothetical protein